MKKCQQNKMKSIDIFDFRVIFIIMKMLISKIELDSKKSRDLIPLECFHCGKTHYRTKNIIFRILHGRLKGTNKGCYCSKKCYNDNKKISKFYNCKQCGNKVERTPSQIGKNVFCSKSCSAKFYNKNKIIWKKCLNCEKEFRPYRGSKTMKYCCHKCQWEFNKKQIYKQIENNTYSVVHSKMYRTYMIEKYGAKCMECGWDKINPTSKKPTIQIEHIDGNSENTKLSNLKLLCPNCHSLTSTFGGLNRGNGRHYRRMRYAAGKSS